MGEVFSARHALDVESPLALVCVERIAAAIALKREVAFIRTEQVNRMTFVQSADWALDDVGADRGNADPLMLAAQAAAWTGPMRCALFLGLGE